jgi:hypothetical protein
LLLIGALGLGMVSAASLATEPSSEEIAALVGQLGDTDYAVRETASARLTEIGPAAADALLAAAELSHDLEVSLRAKWLADSLPLTADDDPPEVTALLEPFAKSSLGERVRIMHRLLRLDDDAGVAALARIVRLERTPTGSRIAAALLAREWAPGEPSWGGIATEVLAGLGPSKRPAAEFLQGLVAATTAATPKEASRGMDAAAAAVRLLDDPSDKVVDAAASVSGESTGRASTGRIFRRCVTELLARAGRREEALSQAAALFESAASEGEGDDNQIVAELQWLASHGLPESVDLLDDRLAEGKASPLLQYAAAIAWRTRGGPDAAARALALSTAATAKLTEGGDFTQRLQVAMHLARFGADDWAEQEYRAVLDDRESPRALRALAAVLASEFFHDRQRDADAAAILRRELEVEGHGKDNDVDGAFMLIERDPRSVRSRMHYFEACAAAAAGDAAGQRRELEASIRDYPKDVDTLIALYRLASNTPAQQAEAAERVAKGLAAIEEEIRALPDDPNCRNEYAWLVANTEGDITRGLEYSRLSLEQSFDSGSYLDTLAHCHAAAGDFDRAIRTQRLALRHEPHSHTIRRNLARFEARAAAGGKATAPDTLTP